MDNHTEQKGVDQFDSVKEQITEQKLPSTHTQSYLQFFGHQKVNQQQPDIGEITNPYIKHKPDYFYKDLQLRIVQHARNCTIVMLQANYGYFEANVSLIISDQKSHIHIHPKQSQFYNFLQSIETKESTIYFLPQDGKRYVIKCFRIPTPEKAPQVLVQAIKEYFLMMIASELGIGINLTNYFGFHIFVHEDCIQFFMEEFEAVTRCLQLFDQNQIQNLKNKVSLLHSLRIVHRDIKPKNILYSHIKKQFFFIDFGYAKAITEQIGFQTKTCFAATLNYCSAQMSALFLKQNGHIDLYYNDVHSFRATIEELKSYKASLKLNFQDGFIGQDEDQVRYLGQNNQTTFENIWCKNLLNKLRFQIFRDNKAYFKDPFYQNFILNNLRIVLQMIAEWPYCRETQALYQFIVEDLDCSKVFVQNFVNMEAKKEYEISMIGKELDSNPNQFARKFNTKDQDVVQLINLDVKSLIVLKEIKWKVLFDVKQKQNFDFLE